MWANVWRMCMAYEMYVCMYAMVANTKLFNGEMLCFLMLFSHDV